MYGTISYSQPYGKVNQNKVTGTICYDTPYGKVYFPEIVISGGSAPTPTWYTTLMDGNTVSWYDSGDSSTIIKDGANAVSAWLKKGFTYGTEKVGAWATQAYWNTYFDGWVADGTTLTSSGGSGECLRGAFYTAGKAYKIEVNVTVNSGTVRIGWDGTTSWKDITTSGTHITYAYLPSAAWLDIKAYSFNGVITSISIKEIIENSLIQRTGTNQPLWSAGGVLFDGVDNFMNTITFTYNQPEMIYMVVQHPTWAISRAIFDGVNLNFSGGVFTTSPTPNIYASAGTASSADSNLAVGSFHILRTLFNGANSKLIVNNNTAITGNFGANNMSGFTLGKVGFSAAYYDNVQVKEVILRKVADNETDETTIYNYLKNKYGL